MSNNKEVLTVLEILEMLENVQEQMSEIAKLSSEDKGTYLELLNKFKEVNGSDECTHTEKGNVLEEMVTFIIRKSVIFEVYKNIHTSSNEIDQLVVLNTKGKILSGKGLINIPGEQFLGECKNYNKTVGATWVGKLYSLMCVTNNKFAILFSYHGMSGSGWQDGIGLTRKIYMLKERLDEKFNIIDFSLKDFEKISEGQSFLELINEKLISLRNDVDISAYKQSHPAEDEITA